MGEADAGPVDVRPGQFEQLPTAILAHDQYSSKPKIGLLKMSAVSDRPSRRLPQSSRDRADDWFWRV
jgi:hypothetical protein